MTSNVDVARGVMDLVNASRFEEAIDAYYAPHIVSVEAMGGDDDPMPREMTGIDAIRGKVQWWGENHDVHEVKVEGPFPHGDDKFALIYDLDVTSKVPGREGRMQMREVGVYTVRDGKIVREEFYYGMPGA